jgi:hypothetical protein
MSTNIGDTHYTSAQNMNMLLRFLEHLRPCLIELTWLENKPVSLNYLVQGGTQSFSLGQNTHDRAQPSQMQVRMRETYLVDRRYFLTVLVRFDCMTNNIPHR